MKRFFVSPENVLKSSIVIDDPNDLHHMRKVLRLREGDTVDISDSVSWEYRARIITLGAEEARLKILDKQSFAAEPRTRITLFQGIPKQGKMETIVQKSVELGVECIVPVFMSRTVVVDKGNFAKKIQRWQRISDEAVKQCRRGKIPKVEAAIRLPEALDRMNAFDLVLFPYENEAGVTIRSVLREFGARSSDKECDKTDAGASIAIIIGPEGGFSDEEASEIRVAGGVSVSLGKTTLRTETAGLAAIAMTMYELEL